MEVAFDGTREHAHEHYAVLLDGHDLSDCWIRFLVPDNEVGTWFQEDAGRGVTPVGVREALLVGAVIVDPQIPSHEFNVTHVPDSE
jgi:hypothetical protein